MKKAQLNIYLPLPWKDELIRIARIRSYEEDRTISLLDLVREALSQEFQLYLISGSAEV